MVTSQHLSLTSCNFYYQRWSNWSFPLSPSLSLSSSSSLSLSLSLLKPKSPWAENSLIQLGRPRAWSTLTRHWEQWNRVMGNQNVSDGWSGEVTIGWDHERSSITDLGFTLKVMKESLKDFKQGSGRTTAYFNEHCNVAEKAWRGLSECSCASGNYVSLLHICASYKIQAQSSCDLGPSISL